MPHGPLQRYNRDAVRADQDVGLLVSRSRNSFDLKRTPLPPHYRRKPVSTAGVGPDIRRVCEMFDPANFGTRTLEGFRRESVQSIYIPSRGLDPPMQIPDF